MHLSTHTNRFFYVDVGYSGALAGCGAEPREILGVFFSPISTDFGHILELYHQSVQKDAVLLAISSKLYDSLMTASRRLLVATTLR